MSMIIGGLASGIDTYQIIEDLMKAHRKPVDKLRQQRQILEWRREEYRAINNLLLNFRTNTVFSMRLGSTLLTKLANSSNASVVAATASPAAANATYNLKVEALATTAYKTSGTISRTADDKIDADASIWAQRGKFAGEIDWQQTDNSESISGTGGTVYRLSHGWISEGTVTITVGADEFEVLFDQDVTGKEPGNWVNIDTETGLLEFGREIGEDETITADYEYNTFSFDITTYDYGGAAVERTFTIGATDGTLNKVLNLISSDKELGVTAFHDAGADRVSISTTRTGDNNTTGDEIQVTGFLAKALQFEGADEVGGTNAVLTVNGMEINRSTNDFTLNNVHFSLKAVGTSTVTVSSDTETLFQQIKHFVAEYNGLLDIINGKLYEERFPDYPPLIGDDAREGLTDRQIDQWEQKARSGLLRFDSVLSGVVSRLRNEVFTAVEGLDPDLNHLAHIGITTSFYGDRGKLVIDEAKLRSAIEQNPEGVAQIFTKRGESTEEQGIAQRLYSSLDAAIKQVTARAGSMTSPTLNDPSWIGRQIRDIDERIQRAEERLETIENRYWRQFAAMERAINLMNAQSMWLAQQMGGGMA